MQSDWHATCYAMTYSVARWPSGLERRTGDRVDLGSNPAGTTSLWNLGNSVYPTLPVSFGGDTNSHHTLLAYMPGEVKYPIQKCVTCCGLHHS